TATICKDSNNPNIFPSLLSTFYGATNTGLYIEVLRHFLVAFSIRNRNFFLLHIVLFSNFVLSQ
ncbi:MAG: hypothetical protein K2K93_11350, partial [Muribaculaceae bacterium]|nr:hypothetical protein [Muribaculaceae bacterium]